jgi:SAM-dependent methyltransferase
MRMHLTLTARWLTPGRGLSAYDSAALMTGNARPHRVETDPRRGGAFYDQPEVFERYQAHRAWPLNANVTLAGSLGRAVLGDLEDFQGLPEMFDLVPSRMALHYLDDIGALLRQCHRSLSGGGRIVFSVVHPVITSHDQRPSTNEPRQDWLVDHYFVEGPRRRVWLGADSVWQHRTIDTYVAELRRAGFALTNLRECAPPPGAFQR